MPGGTVIFTDVTQAAGLDFVHSYGDEDFSNLVEAVGGAAAFLDYDRDGYLDLYLTTGKYVAGLSSGPRPKGHPLNRLYRNLRDGTFADVTRETGVGAEGYFSMGVAVGDFDNDGYPDLYVCNFGRSILFHNVGGRAFRDITTRAGVGNEGLASVAATWLDYDRDGLLDLYVSSYIEFDPDYRFFYAPDGFPGPLAYRAQPDRLYRNRGDLTFEEVTERVGLSGFLGRGMSVVALDLDRDGYPDLYVTNDATENFLFRNEGGERFSPVALERGVGYNGMGDSTASMGVDFGDYDGDGHIDLLVSDDAISSLYRNEGDGFFVDVGVQAGIALNTAQFVGWGVFLFDFNNNGSLDIFIGNSDLSRLFGQEDQILENNGFGRFRDVSQNMGDHFRRELLSRGAAYADYDNDGDLDIVVVNIAGPPVLLRNDGGNRNNWLMVDLEGTVGNRDALGAFVTAEVEGRRITAYRKSTTGYLSCSDPRLHFGLGEARVVDRLEVLWPSGIRQVVEDIEANQILKLLEPSR
jgi:enediyne biosynthesis protein E4